ncbi:hypothetical protein [Halorubrum sp. Atlit-28R]|jgi:hypothetical protein|uniref:hypothetical protein n=1 Tax=Halorubrum sp. Atlit-28R TaxID=2282129 RepID=UPI000EF25BBA|nr:hypothetical protein [Halorubrum sp. Atlit-28R]RLM51989.1 hypothetical protein DVK06_00385 [Halorubrum sp. Atlit-28R]
MGTTGTVVGRLRESVAKWLEQVFYGGAELAVLSTPAFVVALVTQNRYPDAIPIAGLFALAAGSLGLAGFRAGVVDIGAWPRRGELVTLPLRTLYFSLVFFLASIATGVLAVEAVGSLWVAPLGGVVQLSGLAAFPTVYRAIHGEPVTRPVVKR